MKKVILSAVVALSFGLPVVSHAQAIWGNSTTPCTVGTPNCPAPTK